MVANDRKPTQEELKKGRLILADAEGPGDILSITCAVYSLHTKYPGMFRTKMEGVYVDEIYQGNPHHDPNLSDAVRIQLHCPNINLSHLPIHFNSTWCSYLGEMLDLDIPLATPIPILYLSDEERALPRLKNHIVINAGFKNDCACKSWGFHNFQKVVNLMPEITFIQVGESWHNHFPLQGKNVINKVGKMDGRCRPLIQLISQVDGVLSGVTFVQHIAAALGKWAVVLNFREPNSFTFYPLQTMLSSNGCLPCNSPQACWKSGLVPGSENRCSLPLLVNDKWVSTCSTMIGPEEVVRAIRKYYYFKR